MGRLRSLIVGLALFAASSALTLLAVEALLRTGILTGEAIRTAAMLTHATSHMSEPDFRQPGFELRAKEDAFRIVVVGDSFAWGDGLHYEDAFPHRMETRLNAQSRGDRFEVVNWSRPGWNTQRQVKEEGESQQIPTLDLMEVFQGLDARRLALIPYSNGHPSELAHRVAADGIITFLVRCELVPPIHHERQRHSR